MTKTQDLVSVMLFKEVPGGFIYRKPKLWPPAEFYLLTQAQRDDILAATVTPKPWRLIAIYTLLLVLLIAVPTGVFIAWAPAGDLPVVAVIAGVALATAAASYANIRRVQQRVEPILARAMPTDQTFTRAELRQAIGKVGSFKQSWWTAVAFGALSLIFLATFVWDRNYARATLASYLPLLQVVLFAAWAAFILRTAYGKIDYAPQAASTSPSPLVTRPRTMVWSFIAVWLAAFMTMSVFAFRHEFSDLTQGLRLQAAGDNTGAIASLTKAQVANPTDSAVYIARAKAYKAVGNLDGALADLTKTIELEPDGARPYRERAGIFSEKAEWSRSIADYDKAITIDGNDAYTYLFRGTAHAKNKDVERAISDFTKTIEISPKNQYAFLRRGWAYQEKTDHDRAIADFDQAIAIEPKDIVPLIARGVSLVAKKDYSGAVASFTKAIAIDPMSHWAYYRRAEVHFAMKAIEPALADYRTLANLPAITEVDRRYEAIAKRRILLLATPGAVPLTNP